MCPYEGKQNDFRAFLRQIFEVGKKDIKKGFGKISRLEPLRTRFWAAFPEFFRESGSFLLSAKCRISTGVFVGLADTNSKHRCRRVSPLCDVSDVKTAGKPHPIPGRNHGVLAMLGREKAKHPLPAQRVVVYLLDLSRASVFNVTPIMSLWASRVSRQSGDRKVNAF